MGHPAENAPRAPIEEADTAHPLFPEWKKLIFQAIDRNPHKRPQTADAFLKRLKQLAAPPKRKRNPHWAWALLLLILLLPLLRLIPQDSADIEPALPPPAPLPLPPATPTDDDDDAPQTNPAPDMSDTQPTRPLPAVTPPAPTPTIPPENPPQKPVPTYTFPKPPPPPVTIPYEASARGATLRIYSDRIQINVPANQDTSEWRVIVFYQLMDLQAPALHALAIAPPLQTHETPLAAFPRSLPDNTPASGTAMLPIAVQENASVPRIAALFLTTSRAAEWERLIASYSPSATQNPFMDLLAFQQAWHSAYGYPSMPPTAPGGTHADTARRQTDTTAAIAVSTDGIHAYNTSPTRTQPTATAAPRTPSAPDGVLLPANSKATPSPDERIRTQTLPENAYIKLYSDRVCINKGTATRMDDWRVIFICESSTPQVSIHSIIPILSGNTPPSEPPLAQFNPDSNTAAPDGWVRIPYTMTSCFTTTPDTRAGYVFLTTEHPIAWTRYVGRDWPRSTFTARQAMNRLLYAQDTIRQRAAAGY